MYPTTIARKIMIGSSSAVRALGDHVDLLVVGVRDAVEHLLELAGLLADGDHVAYQLGGNAPLCFRGVAMSVPSRMRSRMCAVASAMTRLPTTFWVISRPWTAGTPAGEASRACG